MWALGQMDIGEMGTLELISIEASGHWGQMGTWGKWAPGKMSTRANGRLGQMGTLGQMGIWAKRALRACGH